MWSINAARLAMFSAAAVAAVAVRGVRRLALVRRSNAQRPLRRHRHCSVRPPRWLAPYIAAGPIFRHLPQAVEWKRGGGGGGGDGDGDVDVGVDDAEIDEWVENAIVVARTVFGDEKAARPLDEWSEAERSRVFHLYLPVYVHRVPASPSGFVREVPDL